MTKKPFFRVIPLLVLLCLLLTGCGCKHEWTEANCTTAKTCSLCQITEGEALGHTWVDANCETAKTCSACQKIQGEALGHAWVDATTDAPKTCSVCQKTEGDKIITDSRFTTSACKDLFGTWNGVVEIAGNTIVDPNFTGVLKLDYTIVFNNDGSFNESISMLDEEAFNQSVVDYYIDIFYAQFAAQGLNKQQADDAMKATYGVDVKGYSEKIASGFNWDTLVATERNGVYYVADGKLYSGAGWDKALEEDSYSISNNTLTIDSLMTQFPNLVLTKS